jgi:hypothetical protein
MNDSPSLIVYDGSEHARAEVEQAALYVEGVLHHAHRPVLVVARDE